MALGGGSDQSSVDATDLQASDILQSISGGPGVGPGTFYDQPGPGGSFVAGDNGAADLAAISGSGSIFASVPVWVYLLLAGVVVYRIVK